MRILLHKMKRANSIIALGVLLACCPCAFALDPSLDVSQYAHTAWKTSEGFCKGVIWSIAQTPDGYLWLGTEFGLLRFDGVRAVPWEPPAGEQLPSSDIRSLRVARDGSLWIGTYRGLVSLKDGKLTHYPELDGLIVEWLLEDRERTMWVVAGWALSEARLCRIQSGKTQCYGEDGGFGAGVTTIYEDSGGNVWAGAMTGVWRWKPRPPKLYTMAPAQRTYALIESDDGGILIARRGGITKLRNGTFEPYPMPAGLSFPPDRLLRDRDGGLWVGALVDNGLLHIHEGKTDLFTQADGLSGNTVFSLFEDREGNLWVSTGDGLDRFRDFSVHSLSVQQGLSSRSVSSVLATKDGSVWLGTSDGLNRWRREEITIYRRRSLRDLRGGSLLSESTAKRGPDSTPTIRKVFGSGLPHDVMQSLFEDDHGTIWVATLSGVAVLKSDRLYALAGVPAGNVFAIAGDRADNVWISHDAALFHLHKERVVERIPWANFGRTQPARALLHDGGQGGLWIGFREGGVAFYKDGQLRASYAGAQALGEGIVHSFYPDRDGALWTATEGGLSRIKDGRVLTLTSQNGLPCSNVHWMIEDDADSVWLYTACGLIRVARPELDAWASHAKQIIQASVFDSFDGVGNRSDITEPSPTVAKSTDGRLWFVGTGGVSVIDPHHLHENRLPPPVQIAHIIADGKTYDATNGLRLPPLVRDLTIDYTALSLVAPEKVRFRYMLEGQDPSWKEVVNDRKVQYSNLAPGHYRFRVMASNNSGVWNEEGALLEFAISPAFYQTASFRVFCVVALMALLVLAYQLRVRQLAGQFNRTLDARLSERTRIARELHDTLLQSFQGLLLSFQSVVKILPERPLEARQRLESALDLAAGAITEGRDAVQGLRSSAFETNDLVNGIIAFGQELTNTAANVDHPAIEVEVDGGPRRLNPVVRDEAYRIAGEALRNAFRHARAQRVTVEIKYERRQFRLLVRDDGKGIADTTTLQGQAGHYGLPGMRERAEVVRGKLEVWSKLNSGTQVGLSVPGKIAYGMLSRQSWWSRLFSSNGRANRSKEL
jgi:signal transduction histidine kinase/ligand-binding sensor domain-containing protein